MTEKMPSGYIKISLDDDGALWIEDSGGFSGVDILMYLLNGIRHLVSTCPVEDTKIKLCQAAHAYTGELTLDFLQKSNEAGGSVH